MSSTRIVLIGVAAVALGACAHDYVRWLPPAQLEQLEKHVADAVETHGTLSAPVAGEMGIKEVAPARVILVRSLDALDSDDTQHVYDKEIFEKSAAGGRTLLRYFNRLKIKGVSQEETPDRVFETAFLNELKLACMYKEEWRELAPTQRDPNIGLALSGGGVRSASFASGVLQALHEIGVLDDVGYLSTVSGGGFIGSWYMLHRGNDDDLFGLGSLHQQHLAQNGHYLGAGGHATATTGRLVGTSIQHAALLPVHWLVNGVFDWDLNPPVFRDVYRNSLMTTFLYYEPLENSFDADFSADDSLRSYLPEDSRKEDSKESRPFWIANLHLALGDDPDHFRDRSGDAFEVTPLRAGADAVGYVKVPPLDQIRPTPPETAQSEESESASNVHQPSVHDWMTAGYVVAASGAAVDSESGMTGPWVSLALRAFNFDLGYSIDGWTDGFVKGDGALRTIAKNLHFYVTSPFFVYGILGRMWPFESTDPFGTKLHDERVEAKRYYITDGGHFENLAVYPLVRRGCRLIIVSDGGQDPHVADWNGGSNRNRALAFDSLRRLEELLLSDFGAEVELEWKSFNPSGTGTGRWRDTGSPSGDGSTIMLGTIRNLPRFNKDTDAAGDVKIIYIKAAHEIDPFLRQSFTNIDAEKALTPEFPNESTANQNFSERKVLAHRALGRAAVLSRKDDILQAVKDVKAAYPEMKSIEELMGGSAPSTETDDR